MNRNYQAHAPQLQNLNYGIARALELVLHNERVASACCHQRKSAYINEDPAPPEINTNKVLKKKKTLHALPLKSHQQHSKIDTPKDEKTET